VILTKKKFVKESPEVIRQRRQDSRRCEFLNVRSNYKVHHSPQNTSLLLFCVPFFSFILQGSFRELNQEMEQLETLVKTVSPQCPPSSPPPLVDLCLRFISHHIFQEDVNYFKVCVCFFSLSFFQ
jgi:hypothetical protein